ncbi:hypothetical protein PMAYCL1PPCAC_13072, partial [Pristionchus mayeri]
SITISISTSLLCFHLSSPLRVLSFPRNESSSSEMAFTPIDEETKSRNGEGARQFDFSEWSGLGNLSFESVRQLNWMTCNKVLERDLRMLFKQTLLYYSWKKDQEGGVNHYMALPEMPDIEEDLSSDSMESPASPVESIILIENDSFEESVHRSDSPSYDAPDDSLVDEDAAAPPDEHDCIVLDDDDDSTASAAEEAAQEPQSPAPSGNAFPDTAAEKATLSINTDEEEVYLDPSNKSAIKLEHANASVDNDVHLVVIDDDDIDCVYESPAMKRRRMSSSADNEHSSSSSSIVDTSSSDAHSNESSYASLPSPPSLEETPSSLNSSSLDFSVPPPALSNLQLLQLGETRKLQQVQAANNIVQLEQERVQKHRYGMRIAPNSFGKKE